MAVTALMRPNPAGGNPNFDGIPLALRPPGTDMTGICFRDHLWLRSYPLDRNLVFDYFSLSLFYDWSCNNEQLRMRSIHPLDISHLSYFFTMGSLIAAFFYVSLIIIQLYVFQCKFSVICDAVDAENKSADFDPKVAPPPPFPEGYVPPPTVEAKKGPETQQAAEPQLPPLDPIIDQDSINHSYFLNNTVRGRETSFESARVSILSVIPEESETLYRDSLKAYTCSFSALQTSENGYTEMEEMKMNMGKGSHITFEDISMAIPEDKSTFPANLQSRKTSHFNLLMKNLDKIEESFAKSDLVRLEGDILVQLGKLGALKLFHACLSRTLKAPTVLDLSAPPTELCKEHLMTGATDDHRGSITVHSGRKQERKSMRERASEKAAKISAISSSTVHRGPQHPTFSTAKKLSNSKTRRLILARNESEMSRGVKDVANLERIRNSLEEKIGRVPSFSSWAEAAGVDDKMLQQRLYFGWYCRDKLLRSTRSLVVYLARNYRGVGIAFEDLLQAGNMGVLQGAERAINQIHKARKVLYSSHGRYPDDDEISKSTGLSLAKIRLASKCSRVVGSIDQKMGDSLAVKFMEFTSDPSIKTPEEYVMRQNMEKDIFELLQGLHPRERQVLVLRYGLRDGQCKSLEEIGKLFRVSKEWIRRIEKAALTKVRKEEVHKNLSQYLD
ncbi:hypothetical protein HHK36_006250 [Tetracentron sinense]|uniref:RNA polymerase sigma-70 domain-containing protein n=1 Tax=Tetracentron sinense TaxID=13715 RepID=A0A834ZKI4_TETSI|nr:hypothetical protein HHK36_006250 [Tetracentron sinense]